MVKVSTAKKTISIMNIYHLLISSKAKIWWLQYGKQPVWQNRNPVVQKCEIHTSEPTNAIVSRVNSEVTNKPNNGMNIVQQVVKNNKKVIFKETDNMFKPNGYNKHKNVPLKVAVNKYQKGNGVLQNKYLPLLAPLYG